MVLGDAGVDAGLVVRAVAGERGHRFLDSVEQWVNLGAVVGAVAGQLHGFDPSRAGIHAEVQLAPRAACLGAVLLDQKARGTKLGNPRPDMARVGAIWMEQSARFRAGIAPLIASLRKQGLSLRRIAAELNARDIRTARGRKWQAATVLGVLNARMSVAGENVG